MNRTPAGLALGLGLAALALAPQETQHTQDSLETVMALLTKKDAVLADVREKSEWEDGHIEGALLVPLSWLREESGKDTFALRLAGKVPRKKIVYLYCRSGRRALTAASMLRKQGYDARALKAGFEDLRQAGFTAAK